jgi:2,3-diaminopropionate biosynthesis protein SbnA
MPVITSPLDFNVDDLYIDLRPTVPVYLKVEGFNFAGSIKLKAAKRMVESAERAGRIGPDSTLIESSSGNLGIALSVIAASKGYRFLCITDSRCNLAARQMMESFGSEVHVITEPDPEGGFLGARLNYLRSLCVSNSNYVRLNQYANDGNWEAHYLSTGPAIAEQFPHLDVLFVGAGTTGTLMGCARYFRRTRPQVRIVAVDSVGSVAFGAPPGPRMIPGLGTSVRPQLLDESYVDDVIHVPETETVRCCHELASRGYLFGGSTGTVISGARQWLADNEAGGDRTAVAIAPDFGERYLDSIYQRNWVRNVYGEDLLPPCEATGVLAERGATRTGVSR